MRQLYNRQGRRPGPLHSRSASSRPTDTIGGGNFTSSRPSVPVSDLYTAPPAASPPLRYSPAIPGRSAPRPAARAAARRRGARAASRAERTAGRRCAARRRSAWRRRPRGARRASVDAATWLPIRRIVLILRILASPGSSPPSPMRELGRACPAPAPVRSAPRRNMRGGQPRLPIAAPVRGGRVLGARSLDDAPRAGLPPSHRMPVSRPRPRFTVKPAEFNAPSRGTVVILEYIEKFYLSTMKYGPAAVSRGVVVSRLRVGPPP